MATEIKELHDHIAQAGEANASTTPSLMLPQFNAQAEGNRPPKPTLEDAIEDIYTQCKVRIAYNEELLAYYTDPKTSAEEVEAFLCARYKQSKHLTSTQHGQKYTLSWETGGIPTLEFDIKHYNTIYQWIIARLDPKNLTQDTLDKVYLKLMLHATYDRSQAHYKKELKKPNKEFNFLDKLKAILRPFISQTLDIMINEKHFIFFPMSQRKDFMVDDEGVKIDMDIFDTGVARLKYDMERFQHYVHKVVTQLDAIIFREPSTMDFRTKHSKCTLVLLSSAEQSMFAENRDALVTPLQNQAVEKLKKLIKFIEILKTTKDTQATMISSIMEMKRIAGEIEELYLPIRTLYRSITQRQSENRTRWERYRESFNQCDELEGLISNASGVSYSAFRNFATDIYERIDKKYRAMADKMDNSSLGTTEDLAFLEQGFIELNVLIGELRDKLNIFLKEKETSKSTEDTSPKPPQSKPNDNEGSKKEPKTRKAKRAAKLRAMQQPQPSPAMTPVERAKMLEYNQTLKRLEDAENRKRAGDKAREELALKKASQAIQELDEKELKEREERVKHLPGRLKPKILALFQKLFAYNQWCEADLKSLFLALAAQGETIIEDRTHGGSHYSYILVGNSGETTEDFEDPDLKGSDLKDRLGTWHFDGFFPKRHCDNHIRYFASRGYTQELIARHLKTEPTEPSKVLTEKLH